MESTAADRYKEIMIELGHKHVAVNECGLFILDTVPFIGASPDRIVSCSCCGKHVLEIKCPLKLAHICPSEETVECLKSVGGITKLKRNHSYFTQIQGQMAMTNIHKGHFFVFSMHGHHLEEVVFDGGLWQQVSQNLSSFFHNFLAEELIHKRYQKESFSEITAKDMD